MRDMTLLRLLCNYANNNWKACLTKDEISSSINDIMSDIRWSRENKQIAYNLKTILNNLVEDDTNESIGLAREIMSNLGYSDMDCFDYL